MKLEIVKTFSNNYLLTDAEDENAPMISLHNEFNTPGFAQFLLTIISENYQKFIDNEATHE